MSLPTYHSGILLTKAYRIIRSKTYECLDDYAINASQWSIIGLVYESDKGISLSEVASALGVKKPLITLLVDKLVEDKILKRIDNANDSRSKLLVLQTKGMQLIEELESKLVKTLSPLFDGVSEKDFKTYLNVLNSITSNNERIA